VEHSAKSRGLAGRVATLLYLRSTWAKAQISNVKYDNMIFRYIKTTWEINKGVEE